MWYNLWMTKLLEQVLEVANTLPIDDQHALAEKWMRELDFKRGRWSEEQLASICRGIADSHAGRFATAEDRAALRAKYPSS